MSISANNFLQENHDSDSEANSDVEEPDYYQPISNNTDDDSDSNSSDQQPIQIPNGSVQGIAAIDLNEPNETEEEEEEEMRKAEETAISRAFIEDESRRNAPLPPESATRIMDAMRGISFGDFTPDWARRVPEDRWIEEFRRLKQSPSTAATRN